MEGSASSSDTGVVAEAGFDRTLRSTFDSDFSRLDGLPFAAVLVRLGSDTDLDFLTVRLGVV